MQFRFGRALLGGVASIALLATAGCAGGSLSLGTDGGGSGGGGSGGGGSGGGGSGGGASTFSTAGGENMSNGVGGLLGNTVAGVGDGLSGVGEGLAPGGGDNVIGTTFSALAGTADTVGEVLSDQGALWIADGLGATPLLGDTIDGAVTTLDGLVSPGAHLHIGDENIVGGAAGVAPLLDLPLDNLSSAFDDWSGSFEGTVNAGENLLLPVGGNLPTDGLVSPLVGLDSDGALGTLGALLGDGSNGPSPLVQINTLGATPSGGDLVTLAALEANDPLGATIGDTTINLANVNQLSGGATPGAGLLGGLNISAPPAGGNPLGGLGGLLGN